MGFISCHITLLVIYSLGEDITQAQTHAHMHTHTHTHKHTITYRCSNQQGDFTKPGMIAKGRRMPDLKTYDATYAGEQIFV